MSLSRIIRFILRNHVLDPTLDTRFELYLGRSFELGSNRDRK